MGMSASQARLIALTERMNDIEYQGQQINQQRTTLSNQVNALYNSLLMMRVPTPPSTSDYTKVVYSGKLGASSFTLGNVVPAGTEYNVDIKYQKPGHFVESAGSAPVVSVQEYVNVAKVENTQTNATIKGFKAEKITQVSEAVDDKTSLLCAVSGNEVTSGKFYTKDANGNFIEHTYSDTDQPKDTDTVYVIRSAENTTADDGTKTPKNYTIGEAYKFGGGNAEKIGEDTQSATGNTVPSGYVASDYFIVDGNEYKPATNDDFDTTSDGKLKFKPNVTYYKETNQKTGLQAKNPHYDENNKEATTVNGAYVMTLDQAYDQGRFKSDTLKDYKEALYNAHPEMGENADEVAEKFYIFYTTEDNSQVPHFVAKEDIKVNLKNSQNKSWCEYENYVSNGTYTSTVEEKGCKLEFDSEGRISKISIPIYDENGELQTYKTVELEAATVTDDVAYKDAYNKFEYEKHLYDKEQQEINAKTSIVQEEDKKLELKLTRLDNERNAVNTELEAVKKVVKDNIDKSYKTFNG